MVLQKSGKTILVTAGTIALALGVAAILMHWGNRTVESFDPQSSSRPIRLAVEFNSHAACFYIAESKGWFQEEGIIIEGFDSYVTGVALAAALVNGGIDAAYLCLIPAITAYTNGRAPLKIVAGTHKYGYSLAVDPVTIKSVRDLEHPQIRIGCAREGSPTDALLHKLIEMYHLDRTKVLDNVRRMSPPEQLMALCAGQLDAALMSEQYPTMAEAQGFTVLVRAQDLWPNMQGSVLVVTDELLKKHPEVVEKLVRVTDRATHWLTDHPEDAASIVASELTRAGAQAFPLEAAAIVKGQEVLPEVVFRSLTKSLACTTDLDPAAVQATSDYLVKLGNMPVRFQAEDVLDLRWIHNE